MAAQGTTGSACERTGIPDPTMTLFQVCVNSPVDRVWVAGGRCATLIVVSADRRVSWVLGPRGVVCHVFPLLGVGVLEVEQIESLCHAARIVVAVVGVCVYRFDQTSLVHGCLVK